MLPIFIITKTGFQLLYSCPNPARDLEDAQCRGDGSGVFCLIGNPSVIIHKRTNIRNKCSKKCSFHLYKYKVLWYNPFIPWYNPFMPWNNPFTPWNNPLQAYCIYMNYGGDFWCKMNQKRSLNKNLSSFILNTSPPATSPRR